MFGGHGYTREHRVERLMREAKITPDLGGDEPDPASSYRTRPDRALTRPVHDLVKCPSGRHGRRRLLSIVE